MAKSLLKLDSKVIVLLSVLIISITSALCNTLPKQRLRNVEYYYQLIVDKYGNGIVKITVKVRGYGTLWITLPSKHEYNYSIEMGNVKWETKIHSLSVFYDDVYFDCISRNYCVINITYKFPYMSLMIGKEAWFLSPLIRGSPNAKYLVRVVIPNIANIRKVYPSHYIRNSTGFYFDLTDEVKHAGATRIAIRYTLKQGVEFITVKGRITNETDIIIKLPIIYGKILGQRIIEVYHKAYPILAEIFQIHLKTIKVTFFLPQLNIMTLGYVTASDISTMIKEGTVHLNLALIRFVKGYPEHTMIHELVHILLGKVGVTANTNLRWFHEGMADYIAYKVCLLLGYKNVTMIKKDYDAAVKSYAKMYDHRFGIVKDWNLLSFYGVRVFYGISFGIIYNISEAHGGLAFCKKLIRELKRYHKITKISQVVDAMSAAAGEDLKPLFAKWGFMKVSLIRYSPYMSIVYLMVTAISVVAIWSLFFGTFRRRSKLVIPTSLYTKCPYCLTILPPNSRRCPYCGRYL